MAVRGAPMGGVELHGDMSSTAGVGEQGEPGRAQGHHRECTHMYLGTTPCTPGLSCVCASCFRSVCAVWDNAWPT